MRLHVYLAQCGIASRRASERMIQAHRVQVNGKAVKDLVYIVNPEDRVTVDGVAVQRAPSLYYALNKPTHYLCSNYDQYGRSLAIDLIDNRSNTHLFTVGRLDWLSSGLIFITNDGHFSRKITLPQSEIEREYIVESNIQIPKELLASYCRSYPIGHNGYAIKRLTWSSPYVVHMVLTEGKNREIRNVMDSVRVPVIRLHRVRIGIVDIGALQYGEYRPLTTHEVQTLLRNSDDSGY